MESPVVELKRQFQATEEFLSTEADDVKRKRSKNSLTQVAVCGGCDDDVPPGKYCVALLVSRSHGRGLGGVDVVESLD